MAVTVTVGPRESEDLHKGRPPAWRVYTMRMARVNVYLPDDLADAAREAGLNVSGITQAALMSALAERDTNDWLDSIDRMRPTKVTHAHALEALHATREEMGTVADA